LKEEPLSRPFVTALCAVVFAGALAGVADAESNAPAPSSDAVPTAATASDARVAPSVFEVSPQLRAELGAAQAAVDAPKADADVQMWSGAAAAQATRTQPAQKQDAIHRFARGIISRTSSLAASLTRNAMRFIGTPYVFGGTSSSGFDCSGYTQHVFAMLGIALPRTADAQFYAGRPTRGGNTAGDLVFFQTYLPGPSHVGIYIGGGRFIHSSSHGVRISALSESYWASRYLGAKRVVATR
jgi:cell wall-associated NlpC family hydrolase